MIRINQSQLDSWYCRERYRQRYFLGYQPIKPAIHLAFGSVVHILTAGYWRGESYQQSFNEALRFGIETVDNRLLPAKEVTRWNDLLDSLPAIATMYWGFHGDDYLTQPVILNEKLVEYQYSPNVICYGTIDRLLTGGILRDTKTCSAMDRNWKQTVKWENLRRPQLPFYLRYCQQAGIEVNKVEIEAIVKPYRGSDPDIVILDLTKEIFAQQERFCQQMDWAIREIEHYRNNMAEAAPWPMNRQLCVTKYGECDYLRVCDYKLTEGDPNHFVRIEEEVYVGE